MVYNLFEDVIPAFVSLILIILWGNKYFSSRQIKRTNFILSLFLWGLIIGANGVDMYSNFIGSIHKLRADQLQPELGAGKVGLRSLQQPTSHRGQHRSPKG